MARRTPRLEATQEKTLTPLKERCEQCGQPLWVAYHGHRTVTTLSGLWKLTLVVRQCIEPECPGFHQRYRPEEEGRWALPHGEFGLLRHEVVSVAVGTHTGPNPMFCHWYSTRTCTGSNPRVGSFWDNVASFERMTVKPRGEIVTASTRAVGSKSEMIGPTKCESLINVVNSNKPKVLTGLNQKVSDRSRNLSLSWRRQQCHRRTGEAYVINVVRKRNVEIPYVSRFRVGVSQEGLMDVRG